MNNNSTNTNKSSFSIFNFQLLASTPFNPLPADALSPTVFSQLVEEQFLKKVNLEGNLEIMTKKRGRKANPIIAKKYDDPDITISEIIDLKDSGVPMTSEVKMKEARLNKIQEKRAQKLAAKNQLLLANIAEENNDFSEVSTSISSPAPLAIGEDFPIFAPKLILKNGKLVVDNSSLVAKEVAINQQLAVVEDKKPKKVTSMSFRQRNHTEKWTEAETNKFMAAVKIFGSDFSMIAQLFPNRNRDQIKNKFRKEDKENSKKIDAALNRRAIGFVEFNKENNILKRTVSADSMEMKIMDELKEIINKEIQKNASARDTLALMKK